LLSLVVGRIAAYLLQLQISQLVLDTFEALGELSDAALEHA
jgi:hypothetical protein